MLVPTRFPKEILSPTNKRNEPPRRDILLFEEFGEFGVIGDVGVSL